MFKRIFTKNNFLRSLVSALIFVVGFTFLKYLFYQLGLDDEAGLDFYGSLFYFIGMFLILFFLDGRDYTRKDVIKFKNLNKNK